ncbi:ribokinase [Oryzifoliimicrobium ureilyticus]|uniref:ribokinase n=1 Tax=Oryzifoliimicrobium ureilyticus TaxID=3113724 RepID=UPI00307674E9
MRAYVIGNIALDETYSVSNLPAPGASIFGHESSRDLGGKGCNQAMVMARTGLFTTLTAAIGTDNRASSIRDRLSREPLRKDLVEIQEKSSDLSIILTTPDGENAIITTTSCAEALRPADAEQALHAAQAGDLLVLQGNLSREASLAALQTARDKGLLTAFNPSPLRPWFSELWPLVNIVFLNRGELLSIAGSGNEAGAHQLLSKGPRHIVLTLGKEGSQLVTLQDAILVPAAPAEAIDTTGAGDCFMAVALASAARREVSLDARALCHAAQAAAMTVSRKGTQAAFPSEQQLAAILSE